MKKIAAVLSALMLAVVMVGCAGSANPNLNAQENLWGISWDYNKEWQCDRKVYDNTKNALCTYTLPDGLKISAKVHGGSDVSFEKVLGDYYAIGASADSYEVLENVFTDNKSYAAIRIDGIEVTKEINTYYIYIVSNPRVGNIVIDAYDGCQDIAEDMASSVTFK